MASCLRIAVAVLLGARSHLSGVARWCNSPLDEAKRGSGSVPFLSLVAQHHN
jgi:hypothetical protein